MTGFADSFLGRLLVDGVEKELRGGTNFEGFEVEPLNDENGQPVAWTIRAPEAEIGDVFGGTKIQHTLLSASIAGTAFQETVATFSGIEPAEDSDRVRVSVSVTCNWVWNASTPDGQGGVAFQVLVDGAPAGSGSMAPFIVLASAGINQSTNFGTTFFVVPTLSAGPHDITIVATAFGAGDAGDTVTLDGSATIERVALTL